MQLQNDIEKKFNEQLTLEFESSLAYRQLAIEADEQDLPGISSWFHAQAEEETEHALKFIKFVSDRGNHANIGQLAEHTIKPGLSPIEMFEVALAHEQKVSAAIRDLYRETEAAGDLDSRPILNWFVNEQIEEEETVSEILTRLKLVDGKGSGLLRIDAELGGRHPSIEAAE